MTASRLIFATLILWFGAAAQAEAPVHTGVFGNTAIGGYDAVAYHVDGRPVKGSKDWVYEWRGAQWRFASAEHLARFKAAPQRYAPQYGGYCAYAVGAKNDLVGSDPEAWDIVDGKLYLNYDKDVRKLWQADRDALIRQGDANWPGLVK